MQPQMQPPAFPVPPNLPPPNANAFTFSPNSATRDHSLQQAYPNPTGHSDLATEVGQGIALGLQAFLNAGLFAQGAGTQSLAVGGGDDKGKVYSPDAIAALKGFSNTYDIKDIQPIWSIFQTTKNVDVHRRHLQFNMATWAQNQGVEIDQGIYFEQKSVQDIVNLQFNPGQGVAHFKSAERGLSLLIC